jgi:hypothetical protein
MSAFLLTVLGVLGTFGMTAIGDMVSEEVRERLDHLPHAILRLAERRLDPDQRVTVYEDEWLPELAYILKGDEARPVTRLIHGTRYAFGILVGVHQITRHINRPAPDQSQPLTSAAAPKRKEVRIFGKKERRLRSVNPLTPDERRERWEQEAAAARSGRSAKARI